MMSMWMSFRITHCSDMSWPSQRIVPKMTPVSVDDTCVRRGQCQVYAGKMLIETHLDGRLDALKVVRGDRVRDRALNNLQVTKYGKVQAEVLQCVGRLVDEEYIWGTVSVRLLSKLLSYRA
jgi:hypothetical protein